MRGVVFDCAGCGCQTSVAPNTIFQDTRTRCRFVSWPGVGLATEEGCRLIRFARVLGLESYETAWTWRHKLGLAMVTPGRDLLTGRMKWTSASG